MKKKKKEFTAERWSCLPAYEVVSTDDDFTLTEESKKWLEEAEKETNRQIEKLKKMRDTKNN